jgi:hypothetical protein
MAPYEFIASFMIATILRVLVRNLYSSTLDAVGTGCTFAKGDVRDLSSLYDAMENVDKVSLQCKVQKRLI